MGSKIGFLTNIVIIAIFFGAVTADACSGCRSRRLISGYEEFVANLVEVGEKAKAGDRAAVAQMKELAVEAGEWTQRLEAYAVDFSQEQSLRVADLGKKAAEALGTRSSN
jgi:hypothetical protein